MKVKDILSKTIDNYMKIVVDVFNPYTLRIKKRHIVEPHSSYFGKIPEDVLETEVEMIVLYLDRLVISVPERRA